MIAAISVVLVVAVSMLVTRVATIALTLTGMSRESARFQARSALTGAGFTTAESESVVTHPVRRRIVMTLMLIGSAGIVTVIGTTALSFATAETGGQVTARTLTLLAGLALLVWAAASKPLDRALQPLIHRLLRRYADIDTRDYARLLHIAGAYAVSELAVEADDWLADARLDELRLPDEGVLVLGVQRQDGSYVGAPKGWTTVHAGDVLILYGDTERLADLDRRRAGHGGEGAHQAAVAEQRRIFEEARAKEQAADPEPTT